MNLRGRDFLFPLIISCIILAAASEGMTKAHVKLQRTRLSDGIPDVQADTYGNSSVRDATDCFGKLESLLYKPQNAESISFLDAAGKPVAGLTEGNLIWVGNYEMCDSLRNSRKDKYRSCKVTASVSIGGLQLPKPIIWTGCLPPACLNGSLTGALPYIGELISNYTKGKVIIDPAKLTSECEEDIEYDEGAYVAIAFLSIVGSLVVFGTFWYLLHSILVNDKETTENNKTAPGEIVQNRDNQDQPQEPSRNSRTDLKAVLSNAIKCFSLQQSFKSLASTETKPHQILCLNGIRVLSINWVILGHTYAFVQGNLADPSYLLEVIKRRGFTVIANAFASVDSFFTLSGFLVSYLLLKRLTKRGHLTIPQWIVFYFHRYVRLTAPYLMVILLEGFLYRYLVSGPFSVDATTTTNHETCKRYWWANLLYINNLVPWHPTSGTCLEQSWYLSNDMQFFVIAPLFIVLLFAYPLVGNLVTVGTICCSAISAAIITSHYNLAPSMALGNPQNYLKLYRVPWVRITPYLVGILGGWFYWCWGEQVKEKVKTLPDWKKVLVATPLWLATAAIEYEVVFGLHHDLKESFLHGKVASRADSISYQLLARNGWSLALAVQIILCQCGLGGFINSLLSWKGWLVLSRLTYSVYLIHLGLIMLAQVQLRCSFFLQPDFEYAVFYLGMVVISYLAAVVLYVSVEQPVAQLESLTYRKK